MKKRYLLLGIAMLGLAGISTVSYIHGVDVIKKIKKVGEKVGEKVKKVAKKTGKWFEDQAQKLEKEFKKVVECAGVVPLGTEWAAHKAAFAVASATLDAAKKLQVLDPRRTALQTEKAALIASKGTLIASKKTGDIALEGTKGIALGIGTAGEFIGKAMTGGVDIKRAEFKMNLGQLKKGKLPKFGITAMIGNRKIDFDLDLDLQDVPGSAKSIIETIIKNIK